MAEFETWLSDEGYRIDTQECRVNLENSARNSNNKRGKKNLKKLKEKRLNPNAESFGVGPITVFRSASPATYQLNTPNRTSGLGYNIHGSNRNIHCVSLPTKGLTTLKYAVEVDYTLNTTLK